MESRPNARAAGGRRLLAELDLPEPWLGHVGASVELIDDWTGGSRRSSAGCSAQAPIIAYIPLLMSARGAAPQIAAARPGELSKDP
jgi:hypothetical protein